VTRLSDERMCREREFHFIRLRYTKRSRGKRRFNTGRNSKCLSSQALLGSAGAGSVLVCFNYSLFVHVVSLSIVSVYASWSVVSFSALPIYLLCTDLT